MKDIDGEIQYREKTYKLVFNLNVMESIQKRFGSLQKWGDLTDGSEGEVDVEAVIFGFMEMLNEGIDIENDEQGADRPFLSLKQVGRIISELGFENATAKLNDTVIEATMSDEKNE